MIATPHKPAILTLVSLILSVFATGSVALADDIRVTRFDDVIDDADAGCTLREAIRSANTDTAIGECAAGSGGDRVLLTAGTYVLDLINRSGEDNALDGDLDIQSSLEIRGVAPEYTIIDGVAENSLERLLTIEDAINVTVRGVTLRGGTDELGGNLLVANANAVLELADVIVDGGEANAGGGLYISDDATVVLTRVTLTSNSAIDGGGIALVEGDLTIRDSLLRDNSAMNGGGIVVDVVSTLRLIGSSVRDNDATGIGGGILSAGDNLDIQYSLLQGNTAANGAGLHVSNAEIMADVVHSAFIDNTASSTGGGLRADADVAVRHTTFSGNSAESGGAVYANADVLIDAVTIAQNVGGGGVFNESGVFFEASLIADNVGGNCLGTPPPNSGRFNLEDANTCEFVTGEAEPNFVDMNPLLGALANHGGPTPTFALLPGSPAIDAINSNSVFQLNCQDDPDQRGYPRGRPRGENSVYFCDIGAFEVHAAHVVTSTEDAPDADSAIVAMTADDSDGICAATTGECTLRAAIMQANATPGLDEVELPAGMFTLTLVGNDEDLAETGDLDLLQPIILRGAGAGQTIIDAGQLDRVVDITVAKLDTRPRTYLLQDLTITGGSAEGGGGIRSAEPVRLERVIVDGNDSGTESGGGILCEGTDCAIMVLDSRIVGNRGLFGGGIAQLQDDRGSVVIERSELSNNVAAQAGGGVAGVDLILRNSTVSGNISESTVVAGGGVRTTHAVLEHNTIFANAAGTIDGNGLLVARNGVATGNIITDDATDPSTTTGTCVIDSDLFTSAGYNLTLTDDCGLRESSDLRVTVPMLAPLADNGGPTQTHEPLAGSPAIDAADTTNCPATDQRGVARPQDGGGGGVCDIGAFEVQVIADLRVTMTAAPRTVAVGENVTFTVVIDNAGPAVAADVIATFTFPDRVTVDESSTACTTSGNDIVCESAVGNMASGDSVELDVIATVNEASGIDVTIAVSSAAADPDLSNNTANDGAMVFPAGGGGGGNPGGAGGGNTGGGGGTVSVLVLTLLLLMLLKRVQRRRPPVPREILWSAFSS